MSAFSRNLGRNLLGMPWRLLGIGLTIAGGCGFHAAVGMAMDSIPRTLASFYEETSFADVEVVFVPEDIANLPEVADLPGVEKAEARLLFPSIILLPGGKPLTGMMILSQSPEPAINRFRLIEGTADWGRSGTVVIEQSLAKYQGFRVGDVIASKVGERIYYDTVTGIAVSPEFFSAAANPDFGLAEKGTLGVVFTGMERVGSSLGFSLANDLVFKLSGPDAYARLKPALLERLKGVGVQKITAREMHFSHQNIVILLRSYGIYTAAIIATLLALAMVVAYTTFDRMVFEQSREIGTLLALGTSPLSILWQAAALGACLGLASAVPAWIFALCLRNLFTAGFMQAYGLPFVHNHADAGSAAVMTLICVLIGTAAIAAPFLQLLRKSPLHAMRPAAAQGRAEGKAFRFLSGPAGDLPAAYRYAGRNLLRKRARTGLGALIVGFAIAVPISFAISSTSSVKTLLRNFDQEEWDLNVDFLHPLFQEDADSLLAAAGARKVSPFFRGFGEITGPAATADGRMLGIAWEKGLRRARIVEGREPGPGGAEVLISQDLGRLIGGRPGDTVRIRAGGETQAFLLAGITSDSYPRQVQMDLGAAQRLSGFEGKTTGAYLVGPDLDGAGLAARAEVGRLTDRRGMLAKLLERWEDALFIVRVTTVFSLLMAFIFIVMTLGLNIQEQKGEYALMLALGFRQGEILRIMFTEALAQMALAALISVPLGMLMALRFNAKLGEAWFQTAFHSRASDYVWPLAGALFILPWVVGLGARSVLSLDVGKHLRHRDIG